MKLPEGVNIGVQQFGRYDVGAPGEVARAQSRARQAWDDVFIAATNEVANIHEAHREAQHYQRLQERVIEDSTNGAKLHEYMANSYVINLDDDDVPQRVREAGERWARANPGTDGKAPRLIATHEIIDGVMQNYYKEASEVSLDALRGTMLKGNYLSAMSTQMATVAGETMRVKVQMQQQWLRARADLLFDEALMSGNTEAVTQMAIENAANGIWLPEEASERIREGNSAINRNRLHSNLLNAESQADIDEVGEELEDPEAELLPEDRMTIRTLENQRTEFMTERAQRLTFGKGVTMLARGSLTKNWVESETRTGMLSGTQAKTLYDAMASPPPAVSDPVVVDKFHRRIGGMLTNFDEDVSVDDLYAQLVVELDQAVTGVVSNGGIGVQPKQLTGEDYLELQVLMQNTYDRAIGGGREQMRLANSTIRALTGYTDMLSSIDGTSPQRMAFTEFSAALNNYMKHNPTGDPNEWVLANAERYDNKMYTAEHGQRLVQRYPQYADIMFDNEGEIDAALVATYARKDRERDPEDPFYMTDYEYQTLMSELQYRLISNDELKSTYTEEGE